MNNENNPYQDLLNKPVNLIAIGLCIFVLQLSIVFSMMDIRGPYNLTGMWITVPDFANRLNDPGSVLERVFTRLNGWDGQWYFHIAQNGYQCPGIPESNNPNICNVAFFPAVPILGALMSKLGIDLLYAIPLVSQIAWLATILLVLFFVRSVIPIQPLHILIVAVLVTYPGSVYGFVSYTEALLTFLTLLITTVSYWYLNRPRQILLWVLASACFLVCLTKVSGVLVLGIPVLMALLHPASNGKWFSRNQIQLYAASAAGVLGILLFLSYCEIRFGDWALYFRYVGAGWGGNTAGGLNINPFTIFQSFSWHEYIPLRVSNLVIIILPFVILLLAVAALHYGKSMNYFHIPVVVTVLILFYLYSTLGNDNDFRNYNITRHMFPLIALLTLLAMLLVNRSFHRTGFVAVTLGLLSLIFIQSYAQMYMLDAFRIGNWVS